MYFRLLGRITNVEIIAVGSAIREIERLRRHYGRARWRKRKGIAKIELMDGSVRLAEVHWYEAGALADANSSSSGTWTNMASAKRQLVLCLRSKGYEVSLERRKIYQVLPDRDAASHGQLRVIDESGEDYLYPAAFFAPLKLPRTLRRRVLAAV